MAVRANVVEQAVVLMLAVVAAAGDKARTVLRSRLAHLWLQEGGSKSRGTENSAAAAAVSGGVAVPLDAPADVLRECVERVCG